MIRTIFLLCFSVLLGITSCKDTNSQETKDTKNLKNDENTAQEDKAATKEKERITVYAWVDNLRIRAEPDRKAVIVTTVEEGAKLEFLGEKTAFTEKINLRGSLYEEPWLKIKTVRGEEGWVFGGAVKFYQPKSEADNSPSPYDTCFKYNGSKKESCIKNKRDGELRKNRLRVRKVDNGLRFILLNGEKAEIVDTTKTFEFMYYIQKMGFFVVKETGGVSGQYLLINDKSGRKTEIWGYPKPSPDYKTIVVVNADLERGFEANGVQIFSFTKGSGLEKVYEKEMTEFEPQIPSWVNDDQITLVLEPAPGDAGLVRKIVDIKRGEDGEWK